MILLLTHIADPDGITPIILLNLLQEKFEYKLFEVNDLSKFISENLDSDLFDEYENIYITDLGVEKECADKMANSKYKNKFKIFDHHESRNYLNDYEFAIVAEEINGHKECGTTLFYNFLCIKYKNDVLKKDSVKKFVELVREGDTWDFSKYKDDALNLSILFNFYGKNKFISMYTDFLNKNKNFSFSETEKIILESLNNQKNEYLESFKDEMIIKKIKGYSVGIIFAERYRSELGNYLAEVYQDSIDFVCIINLRRHASLRGIKHEKPVNKFAQIYGGGGHPLAAAFPLNEKIKDEIINYIFR